MGTWTEQSGDNTNGKVLVNGYYGTTGVYFEVHIQEYPGTESVDMTNGTAVAEIIADALNATAAFTSLGVRRTYLPAYADYTP